jgi:hypothetical protein
MTSESENIYSLKDRAMRSIHTLRGIVLIEEKKNSAPEYYKTLETVEEACENCKEAICRLYCAVGQSQSTIEDKNFKLEAQRKLISQLNEKLIKWKDALTLLSTSVSIVLSDRSIGGSGHVPIKSILSDLE